MTAQEVPVLIVGGGPAGLTAAITLARHGIEFVLAERRPHPSPLPRANGVSTWSMELFRSWGLEPEIRSAAADANVLGWICETLAAEDGELMPTGFPSSEQAAAISPSAPAVVGQDEVERVLLRHLRWLGGGDVRFGTELTGFVPHPDRVRATLRDPESGERRTVDAAYMIGADGAYSSVRQALGLEMRGPGRVADGASALFHAPLWGLLDERRFAIYPITHPETGGVFVTVSRHDRWVYGVSGPPDELDPDEFDESEMARRIRLASGVRGLEPGFERITSFSYVAEIADRFREGRVFLAGDAAHRVSPRGATGMNAAIRDGFDLGWKLAWLLSGWARPPLLDTYEAERRPVVEHNALRSVDPQGSVREVADEIHVDLGGRIPHLWLRDGDERISTLDLVGPELTLFTGPDGPAEQLTPDPLYARAPVAIRRLPAVAARGLGVGPGGSLLVRPDGAPAPVVGRAVPTLEFGDEAKPVPG
jgi:2-polyprenyl-6-methoxyphenol hydroxylase-like FAD-dependent oxidoreductase